MNGGLAGSGAYVLPAVPFCLSPRTAHSPICRSLSSPDFTSWCPSPAHCGPVAGQASDSLTQLLPSLFPGLPASSPTPPICSLSPLGLALCLCPAACPLCPHAISPPLHFRLLLIFHEMAWMNPPSGSLPELSQTLYSPCVTLGKPLPILCLVSSSEI